MSGLRVANVAYDAVGEYTSIQYPLVGNLIDVAVAGDGTMHYTEDGVPETISLFSIQTGTHELFLGESSAGVVSDANIVSANISYVDGIMEQDNDYPYMLSTHFIPDNNVLDSFRLGIGTISGVTSFPIPSGAVISDKDDGVDILLPQSFSSEWNLASGSVVTMQYYIAAQDRFGRPYSTHSISIPNSVGKPNITDNRVMNIPYQYLYVPVTSGAVCYAPEEYYPVSISGDLYFCLGSGKGETIDSTVIIASEGTLFARGKYTAGPLNDFYYGSIGEPVTVVSGSGSLYHCATSYPYIKGTLKIFNGKYIVSAVDEYPTDDPTDPSVGILSLADKTRFTVSGDFDTWDLTAGYIPIDNTDVSPYINTNIAQHNAVERFTGTQRASITLSRYPYIDAHIIQSDSFASSDGVFSLLYKYSITYEPVVVYVNGIKARNITDYENGGTPVFSEKIRETDYQYYVRNGNELVFNEELVGNIMVYYYVLSDNLQAKITMMRSNIIRDDLSPEMFNYTLLTNILR